MPTIAKQQTALGVMILSIQQILGLAGSGGLSRVHTAWEAHVAETAPVRGRPSEIFFDSDVVEDAAAVEEEDI